MVSIPADFSGLRSYRPFGKAGFAVGLVLTFLSGSASAQRADDNVLATAGDAFGSTVGNEQVGLYGNELVRGFSPVVAGNIRIAGLYFDQVGEPNDRLVDGSTIRVAMTAQAYPFPAPTGIVDYRLRLPGSKRVASTVVGLSDFYGPYAQLDLKMPLRGDRLGVAAGIGLTDQEFADGSDSRLRTAALTLNWEPVKAVSLTAFWSREDADDAEAQPLITVAGDYLPPRLPRRVFLGQRWATNNNRVSNSGLLGSFDFGSGWIIRTGLFRSSRTDQSEFTDIFRNMRPDFTAQHVITADPSKHAESWSGEFRITRLVVEGPRHHALRLILRGRARDSKYGGSEMLDFGLQPVGVLAAFPKPPLDFDEQTRDRVRQQTAGFAYEGLWKEVGQLSFGIQRTEYRKTVEQPSLPATRTGASPLLFYVNGAVFLSKRLSFFAGHTRGLEETGVAPENAVNRGQGLPAARTQQTDAGLRFAISPRFTLVAGLFDVRKPYFNLDSASVFTNLGQVSNRGAEISVAGNVLSRLRIVAGAVFLKARVSGDAVDLGRVGPRPINSSPQRIRADLQYSPPWIDGLAVDFGFEFDGERVASRDNRLILPQKHLLKGGFRQRFRLGASQAQFRLFMEDIQDNFFWKITNSGGLRISAGRRLRGQLAVDF